MGVAPRHSCCVPPSADPWNPTRTRTWLSPQEYASRENTGKHRVVRRIPSVKGHCSGWRDCGPGASTERRGVLPLCGSAPVRALFSGHRGSASMDGAWVGPLYWIRWAGGHRRLHPRGRRTGPGGGVRLPDRAMRTACTESVQRCSSILDLAEYSPPPSEVKYRFHHGTCGRVGCSGGAFRGRIHVAGRGSIPRFRPSTRVSSPLRGHLHRGALRGAQAAPPTLRRSLFVAAWCPVRAVPWLSTACGGGDAVVGGMEQYRRSCA